MTRHYFNPDDVDFFRSTRGMVSQLSQERSLPLAISHANREESRNCPIGRHGNRPSPPQESDLEATGTQPRRRIAVAVSHPHFYLSFLPVPSGISFVLFYSMFTKLIIIHIPVRSMSKKKDQMQRRSGNRWRMPKL